MCIGSIHGREVLNYIRDDSCYIFGMRIPEGVKCASLYEYALANFIRSTKEVNAAEGDKGESEGKGKGRKGRGNWRRWNKDGEANTDGQFQFNSVTQMHIAISEGCRKNLSTMKNKEAKEQGLLKYKKLFARGKEWVREFITIVFSNRGRTRNGGNNHSHRAKEVKEAVLDELLEMTLPPQEKPVIMECKSASKDLRTYNDRYVELVRLMDGVNNSRFKGFINKVVEDAGVIQDASGVDALETDE